ncbi:MAG: ATP-binding protein [Nitrosospira sp.]
MLDIDKNTLEEWVASHATESEMLEFKAILPERDGKQEFLKDVSAMANSNGGVIVYGISEKAGQAENIFAIKTENSDHAIRRLEQCMESGIEPRLTGVKFKEISV